MQEISPPKAARPDKVISVIGFDYGTKRVGVAVGQTITGTASALPVIESNSRHVLWSRLDELVNKWQPDAMVIGLPFRMDGTTQPMTHKVEAFIQRLQKKYSLPVFAMDERLTTTEARSQAGSRKTNIDSEAARIILESWLRQLESCGKKHCG